jgi:hydrogenase maturation protein HypF
MRRSRGLVPRPVTLVRPLARPVLACGAQLKNAFCLAAGGEATLGPHIGDLENLETLASFEAAVARLERFLRVRPEVLAHDLHPDYPSTRYARERARAEGIPAVGVQHHHAHAASAMAEHGLAGPALALAWDGVGLGTDGSAWGGELLLARYEGFRRLATLRPVPLPGGDRAVLEPWRIALALLDEAFEGSPPEAALRPLLAASGAADREVEAVRRMVAAALNTPRVHGVGRLFDAVGALALLRPRSRYEGQVAVALDAAADDAEPGSYPFDVDASGEPSRLDWRPALRAVAADLVRGARPGAIAARFHRGLAAGGAALVREAAARHGPLPVVLTGGVFQNARLAEQVRGELSPRLEVYLHSEVPPGDGGVALGQAVIAGAAARD